MKRFLAIVLLILYTAVLVYFSVADIDQPGAGVRNIDKLYHAIAYTILALLLVFSYKREVNLLLVISIAASFGAVMEICQHFIIFRSASFADEAANTAGAVTGAYLGVWVKEHFKTLMYRRG